MRTRAFKATAAALLTAAGVLAALTATSGTAQGVAPTAPPSRACTTRPAGPTTAPPGAVTINPAVVGDADAKTRANPGGTTFWFAPGVHKFAASPFGQAIPKDGNTYLAAPGAVLDGQNVNLFAFTGQAKNVKISSLEVRGFMSPRDQGVVNHDMGDNWTMENLFVHHNKGAGVLLATGNTLRGSCLADNGQYGFQALGNPTTGPVGVLMENNEIARNNADDLEHVDGGCGCTGGGKFWLSDGATVQNNWVHDNLSTGLWFDNNNRNALVQNNLIEGNTAEGIFVEAGYDVNIIDNTLRRNALGKGKEFADRGDSFPVGAIYVSEDGSPPGYNLRSQPMRISGNVLTDNWNGVILWENSDRYSGSGAHTHVSGTIKVGDLLTDDACKTDTPNDIPDNIDKYNCRWSTEYVIVENNQFTVDKAAVGCVGSDKCGLNGMFSNAGFFQEFTGWEIPWRIMFQQHNVFRNNTYTGPWAFAAFEPGQRATWTNWTAPAPALPPIEQQRTTNVRPTTFGQDAGSTFNGGTAPPPATTTTQAPPPATTTTAAPPPAEPARIALNEFEQNTDSHAQTARVTRSTVNPLAGSASLLMETTAVGGSTVRLDNGAGYAGVQPGKVHRFLFLYREAKATMPVVNWTVEWTKADGSVVKVDQAPDLNRNTGTATGEARLVAPEGATNVRWVFQWNSPTVGPAWQLDGLTVSVLP